jgi:hypothetical protein
MANTTRKTGSIDARISGLLLATALMAAGCTQAIARHDVFERSDVRIGQSLESARRTCQGRQPNNARPSAGDYERCVLEALRGAGLTPARQ